jgi:hypothetical protein
MQHRIQLWLLLPALGLSGCATQAARPPPRVAAPEPVPAPIYVYPAAGQTAEQLDRDRYECHQWSVKQSGFDPSRSYPGLRERVEVRAGPPPGATTLGGAVAGAVIGAAIAGPHDAAGGAAVGAIAGAAVGASAEAAVSSRASNSGRSDQQRRRLEGRASDYRRAITACLEGRQYTVK